MDIRHIYDDQNDLHFAELPYKSVKSKQRFLKHATFYKWRNWGASHPPFKGTLIYMFVSRIISLNK